MLLPEKQRGNYQGRVMNLLKRTGVFPAAMRSWILQITGGLNPRRSAIYMSSLLNTEIWRFRPKSSLGATQPQSLTVKIRINLKDNLNTRKKRKRRSEKWVFVFGLRGWGDLRSEVMLTGGTIG